MEKVTIVTSWGGGIYPIDYVNRLFRACKRNMTRPFEFVLFAGPGLETNNLDPEISIVNVGLPYWWAGMPFWMYPAPGVFTETRLFLDLDVVVVGNLDRLLDVDSQFCCSRDWASHNAPIGHGKDANPGVTLLRGNAGAWVWDEYMRAGMPVWNPQDRKVDHSPCHMAAQGIINERGGVDLYPQELCASYKYTVQRFGIPDGCVTVHFHGQPKPHEMNEAWVHDHWK